MPLSSSYLIAYHWCSSVCVCGGGCFWFGVIVVFVCLWRRGGVKIYFISSVISLFLAVEIEIVKCFKSIFLFFSRNGSLEKCFISEVVVVVVVVN